MKKKTHGVLSPKILGRGRGRDQMQNYEENVCYSETLKRVWYIMQLISNIYKKGGGVYVEL